jgi:hypothetical protein
MADESSFPTCDCCSSLEKLTLVVVTTPDKIRKGEIACAKCFSAYGLATDTQTSLYIRRENNVQIAMLLAAIDKKSPNAAKLENIVQGLILQR